ncbi:MAG: glutamate-5-semialdehyde dehydrogenase [Candidatus Omnitrophota bacterium]|jgi:glutamate-5-semialdehyde dehydrogenase
MSQASMQQQAKKAKAASFELCNLSSGKRNAILKSMAQNILKSAMAILSANKKDLVNAKSMDLSDAMMSRLTLNEKKIKGMADGLKQIAALPDPLNITLDTIKRPNGLQIKKCSVPLGVILIIFESRPNVTADCAGLCLKSGNSVILRGGKEAFHSNQAIHAVLASSLKKHGVSTGAVEFVKTTDRSDVDYLLQFDQLIDVVIPRGGESLIRKVTAKSRIPVIKHYQGICHTYIDKDADLKMALDIAENAKVQSPGVCNAMETLLVDKRIAKKFLTQFEKRMQACDVELRGCKRTKTIIPNVKLAKEKDWATEYLALVLSIKVVDGVDQAIEHVRQYGSNHSDAIISQNTKARQRFVGGVPSACVFENASTRFSDGGEFGMGAEMGISTDKLHARGPVGLKELTSYRYIISGNGQIRT